MKKGKQILVVDDDPKVLDQLQSQLEEKGFKVSTALNGKSALEQVGKKRPDLITLDIMMPEMDGYETCFYLKENPETNQIPVILVTSRGKMKSRLTGMSFGADFYIAKPFEIEALLELMEKAMPA